MPAPLDFRLRVFECLTKHGFDDGREICTEEIKKALRDSCEKVAERLTGIVEHFEPCIIETSHSPYYVGFIDERTDDIINFWELPEDVRGRIEQGIDSASRELA